MNSLLKTALGLAAIGTSVALNAQSLYNPTRTAKDQGLVLKSWGSGTIAETDETAFEGATSIRVSSRNYFQGGIVNFATPIDLGAAYDDKNNLLRFTLMVPSSTGSTNTGKGGGGVPGGKGGGGGVPGGKGGGAGAGGLDEGGARGGGLPGGKGGGASAGTQGTTLTTSRTLESLRLVITTTDGLRSEAFLDLQSKVKDERGWVKSGIPLQAIAGFGRTNKVIQSIALAGDTTATFYVGEVDILNDSTQVMAEVQEDYLNLAIGDERTFVANGYGGSSPLKFTWDFDSSDGIQDDAIGQVVKRKFRRPGKYVITLTVSDVYGLKKPDSKTITVEVNP